MTKILLFQKHRCFLPTTRLNHPADTLVPIFYIRCCNNNNRWSVMLLKIDVVLPAALAAGNTTSICSTQSRWKTILTMIIAHVQFYLFNSRVKSKIKVINTLEIIKEVCTSGEPKSILFMYYIYYKILGEVPPHP